MRPDTPIRNSAANTHLPAGSAALVRRPVTGRSRLTALPARCFHVPGSGEECAPNAVMSTASQAGWLVRLLSVITPEVVCEYLAKQLLEPFLRTLQTLAVWIDIPDGHRDGWVLGFSSTTGLNSRTPA
jgi:hypothetical protein